MPAIERFVGPDEEILWAARPHAAALARPLALASLAVLLGAAAVLASFGSDLTGAPIAALARRGDHAPSRSCAPDAPSSAGIAP